jgi:hypothetical protein
MSNNLFVERRTPWYLLTGLLIGIMLGIVYAYIISPVKQVDTHPYTLRAGFKEQYRVLIAHAYLSNGDLGRAEVRLSLLGDPDPARTLALQAQTLAADNNSIQDARALGLLAEALMSRIMEITPTAVTTSVITEENEVTSTATMRIPTEDASSSPGITNTPAIPSTPTPTRTPLAPFTLQSFNDVCDPNQGQALIQVYIINAYGQPVPGVQVNVFWDGGDSQFVTGLIPEVGLGYADFEMEPGKLYNVQLVEGGETVSDLFPVECTDEGEDKYWGGWQVVYAQPAQPTPIPSNTPIPEDAAEESPNSTPEG